MMTCISRLLFPAILYILFLPLFSMAGMGVQTQPKFTPEENCDHCHAKIYDQIWEYPVKHASFGRGNCSMCHLAEPDAEFGRRANSLSDSNPGFRPDSDFKSGNNTDKPRREKWERIPLKNYASEHLAILNNPESNSNYLVKIGMKDRKGERNESEILSFVPASVSEFMTDDEIPPEISGVELKKINFSVFVSADIAWETDKFSTSMVEYGKTDDYGSHTRSIAYSRKHYIKLHRLSHKKKYHFRVTSVDLFGNKTVSEDFIFDTSKASDRQEPEIQETNDDSKPAFESIRILKFRQKEGNGKSKETNRVAILFRASGDVTSTVEYRKKENKKKETIEENVPDEETDWKTGIAGAEGEMASKILSEEEKHGKRGLKNRRETGLSACIECHAQGASHPVDIPGRGDIVIPDNLPTGEGGVIICVTCHTPHGGELQYLARMDFEENLCVLCHKNQS